MDADGLRDLTSFPNEADVAELKDALLSGSTQRGRVRQPLPNGVVEDILNKASYWPCIKHVNIVVVENAAEANMLFLRSQPLPGSVKRVMISIESHDQGWSSFPQDHGTKRNSWTFGELELVGQDGKPKVNSRTRLFTNIHADRNWKTHNVCIDEEDELIRMAAVGDEFRIYLRSMFPGWTISARNAKMYAFYDA